MNVPTEDEKSCGLTACTAGRRRQPWPAKRCSTRITVEHGQLQIGIKRLTCSRRNGTRSALEARHNVLYKPTTTTTAIQLLQNIPFPQLAKW